MTNWLNAGIYSVYMKIAEPRVVRILQFWIYIGMLASGVFVLFQVPHALEKVAGFGFVIMLAGFLVLGALFSAIAVLPGIWWLERTGLVLQAFGLVMYSVMVIALASSPIGIAVCLVLVLSFVQRWLEIKGSQLAPLAPKRG